jgi:hypothetical protein
MPVLQWLNRNDALRVADHTPYRILEEVPALSVGDSSTENMLIQGDNLDALKALLPYYAGQVKCIYIDPPYNTGHAFEQYDDNVEHSTWLSLLYPRLQLLRDFLTEDGSIWISIDDDECHYLKVICDEVFGRKNFIATVIWEKKFSPQNDAKHLSDNHDFILCYAKNRDLVDIRKLDRGEKENKNYENPDNDPRGAWASGDYTCNKSIEERPNLYYGITNPTTGKVVYPLKTAVWRYNQETHLENERQGLVWWGLSGRNGRPRYKRFLADIENKGVVAKTLWRYDEVGNTQDAKKECTKLNPDAPFSTPKPEKLIQRILEVSTIPGELVMDSFLGSGTTAAVAHKMGRRYIGIEMGEHAVTHCAPRLVKVIEGEQGGISKVLKWQGGGGFRFYRLGETIFTESGEINPTISFNALAAHIWFSETYTPRPQDAPHSTYLGLHDKTAYALLYNGILKDRRINGGNVLTRKTLATILQDMGDVQYDKLVIYGESCRLGVTTLQEKNILFKQTPYDVRA